ncbi:unnamed protein product, partial [Urochloa humidicola]
VGRGRQCDVGRGRRCKPVRRVARLPPLRRKAELQPPRQETGVGSATPKAGSSTPDGSRGWSATFAAHPRYGTAGGQRGELGAEPCPLQADGQPLRPRVSAAGACSLGSTSRSTGPATLRIDWIQEAPCAAVGVKRPPDLGGAGQMHGRVLARGPSVL